MQVHACACAVRSSLAIAIEPIVKEGGVPGVLNVGSLADGREEKSPIFFLGSLSVEYRLNIVPIRGNTFTVRSSMPERKLRTKRCCFQRVLMTWEALWRRGETLKRNVGMRPSSVTCSNGESPTSTHSTCLVLQ